MCAFVYVYMSIFVHTCTCGPIKASLGPNTNEDPMRERTCMNHMNLETMDLSC